MRREELSRVLLWLLVATVEPLCHSQPAEPLLNGTLEQVAALRHVQRADAVASFRAHCLHVAPCLLPASLSPATRADTNQWSRKGLLSRHADTLVVLGTNQSLAVRGIPSPREPTRLGFYLNEQQQEKQEEQEENCTAPSHSGYLFLSAANKRSHGPLLDDAAEAASRWSRGPLAEFMGVLEPSEPVIAVSARTGAGIPWHRHHAAWLLLLHGSKRWHLYPPSVQPPGMTPQDSASSDISEENDDSGGHSAWVRSVLPTLGAGKRPLEALQRPGELIYVPEGWWHATISDGVEYSVGIGAQARQADSAGSLRLAMDVVPLMETGEFEAALVLTRGALSEGVANLREVSELHGDILMAIIERDGEQGNEAQLAAAVSAYDTAVSAALSPEDDIEDTSPFATLFFKLGRAQSSAQLLQAAYASYKSAMKADPKNELGVKSEALLAMAVDALNSGHINEGIRRAGAALKWGHGRAASILQDIHDKATTAGDAHISVAARKQLERMS